MAKGRKNSPLPRDALWNGDSRQTGTHAKIKKGALLSQDALFEISELMCCPVY